MPKGIYARKKKCPHGNNLISTCKLCKKANNKVWRNNHKEQLKVYGKEYYRLHKEELKVYNSIHVEELRSYRKSNSKKRYETYRKWLSLHPNYQKGKYKEYHQVYYVKNMDRQKKLHKIWVRNLKVEVLSHYSNGSPYCECCKEKHIEFLSIDHINGGGRKHLREIGLESGGWRFYQWLKKNSYPQGFRVLCYNCNQALGHLGYCPHKKSELEISEIYSVKGLEKRVL
jgi:hypothetical protein